MKRKIYQDCRPEDKQKGGPGYPAKSARQLAGKNVTKYHKHQDDINEQAKAASRQQEFYLPHLRYGRQQKHQSDSKKNGKYRICFLKCAHVINCQGRMDCGETARFPDIFSDAARAYTIYTLWSINLRTLPCLLLMQMKWLLYLI